MVAKAKAKAKAKANWGTGGEEVKRRAAELMEAVRVQMEGEEKERAIDSFFEFFRYKKGGEEGEVQAKAEAKAEAKAKAKAQAEHSALGPVRNRTKVQGRRKAPADVNRVKKTQRKPSPQLRAPEKRLSAYRRLPKGFIFRPPPSRHGLLQEKHAFDPWRVIVICMCLNNTSGVQVRQVLDELFTLCPDAETTTKVDAQHIEKATRLLGLQKKRAQIIKRFSEEYLRPDWTHVTELHGVGKYAADAYAIFCTGLGACVRPTDHKLVDYWNFVYGKDSGSGVAA